VCGVWRRDQDVTEPQPKKPFTDPHLVVYGDIQKITNAIGKVGSADAGAMGTAVKTR
jgi:hypothetical protein